MYEAKTRTDCQNQVFDGGVIRCITQIFTDLVYIVQINNCARGYTAAKNQI